MNHSKTSATTAATFSSATRDVTASRLPNEEYPKLTMMNEDQLGEFYRRIGAALCHLQFLEDALVTFLTMKIIYERRRAGEMGTTADAERLLADKRQQLTLGPLIECCISKRIVLPEHQGRIKRLKAERDWLVHRYIVENGDEIYGTATRRASFSRITAIQEEATAFKQIVVAALELWSAKHDVDVGAAQHRAEEEMRKLADQS